MHNRIKKAFTLIEMMIVITIIAIISGVIASNMSGATQAANIAKSRAFSLSIVNSLAAGLAGEWKFDKINFPATNQTPDTWSTNTCTLSGSPLPTLLTTGCIDGNCLSFNGTSAYLDCGAFRNLTLFTLSAWVKPGTDVSDYRTIIDKTTTSSSRNYWLAVEQTSGVASLRLSVGGTGSTITGSKAINDNNWHFVVGTYNNATARVFVDGALSGSGALTGSADSATFNLAIGRELMAGYTRYFIGSIDDVKIFGMGMSAMKIKEDYYAGLQKLLAKGEISENDYSQRLIGFYNENLALLTK